MPRVLVIDDEQNIRSVLSRLLKELGYHVEVAEDGEKGIELFDKAGDFDLVITDICMPNVDGNQVARYIRISNKPDTPLVAITGFPEEIQDGLFDSSLTKPFKLEDLSRMVRSVER
jgi:CheY-like chemotaxis protein